MYIARDIDEHLQQWAHATGQKPLLVRGARQVGKTTCIRHLASSFKYYLEVDLSQGAFDPDRDLFDSDLDVRKLWENLAAIHDIPVAALDSTLLFIDEIQACPKAIMRLRYFYEQLPLLHVIAAGSLLEFALEDLPSFGVGRIRSVFIYPLSFREFLRAEKGSGLVDLISKANPSEPLVNTVHENILFYLRIFLIIGGMPEVIASYVHSHDIKKCQQILDDLIVSFRDDFKKYKKNVPEARIADTFESVASQGQGKFIYAHVCEGARSVQIKDAISVLEMAGLVYSVVHSSANGIPLGSEINEKYRRIIMLDTGMVQRLLNLNLADLLNPNSLLMNNRGALAEIFVGNELVKASNPFLMAKLYCWHRETKKSQAEVDYLVQINESVIPIEVKSGSTGSMQSLRLFMKEKHCEYGVRTSVENFCTHEKIKVYPLYAISNLLRQGESLI